MISNQPTELSQTDPESQPISSYMFAPGIFFSANEGNNFLSSLDIDTKDYVVNHINEFKTRQDIDDCICRLHSKDTK